jgi:non-specific serine/threonine protein kinase
LVGQWDLDAARAVGASDEVPAERVLEVLEQLEFRSVVAADLTGDAPRFRMRETFRQEGRRRAAGASGLVDEIRRRHARHFADGVQRTGQLQYTPRELEGMRWFGTHLPNIRAALEASCEVPDLAPVGLAIATGLGGYLAWWFHGSLNEGRSWLARTAALDTRPSPLRFLALAQQAFFTTLQGDHDEASLLLAQARQVLAVCDPTDPATVHASAAMAGIEGAHRWLSGHPDSVEMLLQAADQMAELGQRGMRYFLLNLAVFAGAAYSTDSAEMLRLAKWLLVDTADAGYPEWNRSWALATAGLTELRHGDPVKAIGLLRDGLRQQLAAGDQWGPGLVGIELAEALAVVGQTEMAGTLLRAAVALVVRSGIRLGSMPPLAYGVERADRILGTDALHPMSMVSGAEAEATLLALVSGERGRALSDAEATAAPGRGLGPAGAPDEPAGRALSERELMVAELVAEGLTYREIAEKLFISIRTVESHIQNIMGKLDARNRTEIGRWWHRRN